MKQFNRVFLPLTLIALGCSETWGHPGHGQPGAAHYVSEPEHRVFVIAALLAVGLFWLVARRSLLSSRFPGHITLDRTRR